MNYVWNYVLISWLIIKFLVLSLVPAQLEYTAVVDANEDPTSLNCPEDAFITIVDVSIKTEGYCETEPCRINNIDNEVIRGVCENSTNCLIYRSNFSSACLVEQRHFNLSYLCEAPKSLDCNFETDLLCNWEQGTDDDFNWTRNSGKTDSEDTGPDSDHTTNSNNGFYMYIEATGKPRNLRAELISKPILCTKFQCLTFWYHMFGDDIGSLSVYQKYKTKKRKRWGKKNPKDKQWILASVELNCDEEFQIIIEGETKNDYPNWKGDIALDDIHVFEGKCDEGRTEICNFEQQHSCGLNNALDKPEYISWYIVQGKGTKKGPAVDHTIQSEEGFFFHLEALETSGEGRLDTISFAFTGLHCFTIWYYIIGNSANDLKLYQMSGGEIREILSVSGDSEEKWTKYTVSVDIAYLDQIIIEGSITQFGSISFDDITFSKGACIEDEVYNYFCLSINQQYTIDGCATFFLRSESLNVALHPSFTYSYNEMECIDKENEIRRNLEIDCRENYLYSNCRINLESFFPDDNKCFNYKKRILITYLCTDSDEGVTLPTSNNIATEEKTTTVSSDSTSRDSSAVSDESVTLPRSMRSSSDSATGLVVGLVISVLLLSCVVLLIVVLIRRHSFKSNPREKIRNNLGGNDYIGSQDIALPPTANHSSHMLNNGMYDGSSNTSVNGYDNRHANAQINNIQHEYTNLGAINGFVNKEKLQVPTHANRQDKTFTDNHMLNDDEYAIVDPTAETSFNETIDNRTGTADSYMILDPTTETGFNRQIFPNTPVGYEFAKPVKDTENTICDDDQYAISDEGVYDHSGSNRHKELENNIYNHAVDTMYDSGSHKRNNEGEEDTYDHFFGQKTEDDYDVSTTT